MVKLLTVSDVSKILSEYGIENYISKLIEELKKDFSNWNNFEKTPRLAHHTPNGVLELMPIGDDKNYSFKFVNGHPYNPNFDKQTVVASGTLAESKHGYPLLISEMTVLTALRTAATSALATDLMSRKNAKTLAIIGTGAQSEFQIIAHQMIRPLEKIYYFDTDKNAMKKFENNMKNNHNSSFIPCKNAEECVKHADIIIVVTATKNHVQVLKNDWIKEGVHINGLGGDCPGKTELEMDILRRADSVVVEFFEQSFIEGEIQHFSREEALKIANTHLYEIITQEKIARKNDSDITLFDSVGFALEDFSVLNLTYKLSIELNIGKEIDMIPPIDDPKNLFSCVDTNTEQIPFKEASKKAI